MRKLLLCICMLATILLSTSSMAARYYRWVNDDGTKVIKDHLPPEIVPKGYEIVNEYGRILKKVPPTLTAEEKAAFKRQKELAELEAARQKAQAEADATLMNQYTNSDQLLRVRDKQLETIDNQIEIRNTQAKQIQHLLEVEQEKAADLERKNQKVTADILEKVTSYKKIIAESKNFIDAKEQEKKTIKVQFEDDLVRFKELSSLKLLYRRSQKQGFDLDEYTNIYTCTNSLDCQKAWQLAQLYVKENATQRMEIITDTLILTEKPLGSNDIAISFSRMPDQDEQVQIIMEVRCYNSEPGRKLCSSKKVKSIVSGFQPYVESKLQ